MFSLNVGIQLMRSAGTNSFGWLCVLLTTACASTPLQAAEILESKRPNSAVVVKAFHDEWSAMTLRDRRTMPRGGEPVVVSVPLRMPLMLSASVEQSGQVAELTSFPLEMPSEAPQSVGRSFQAIGLQDQFSDFGTGSIPPDTMGAVGPNHFVEIINSSVAIYTKNGIRLNHVSLASFFTMTYGGTTYPRNGAFDPRVLYDRRSGRWFATTLERGNPSSDENHVILAVSASGDPTGSWNKYLVPIGDPSSGGTTYFTDYETLGTDDNGVYIAARIFPSSGSSHAKIAALDKTALLSGTATVYFFNSITDMYSTPQPAYNFDTVGASDPAWFFSASAYVYANIHYRRLTWSGGTPSIDPSATVVSTPSFSAPMNAPSSGSSVDINTGDMRLQMATIRNGRLWTCRTIGLNASGGASGSDRCGCEWFELNIASGSASLIQSGRVYDSTASNARFFFYPSLAVSGQEHVLMGFSGVRSTEYVGAYHAGRLAGDSTGTMGSPEQFKAGEASYERVDSSGRNRWGDYSFTSLDPGDDMTMWTIQEYAESNGANQWGTWVAELLAPAPELNNPSASGAQGQTGVVVNVTGTGFYDPGTGFAGRLEVVITGGAPNGVGNYVTTYISPTQASMVFDIDAGASVGARDIRITNPDGQSAVVVAGFSVVSGQKTLSVTSEYGNAAPPDGTDSYTSGTNMTCSITSMPVVVEDSESWKSCICTGWVGTGSVPASGNTTNTGSFTLTEDSAITWLWTIQNSAFSNQTVNVTNVISAQDNIRAGDGYTIEPPGDIIFEAGTEIRLTPGFHAKTGSVFRATITP